MEERLLTDVEMNKWLKSYGSQFIPTFIFKIAERKTIEDLKKEENDKRNRKSNTSRANCKQSNTRNSIQL